MSNVCPFCGKPVTANRLRWRLMDGIGVDVGCENHRVTMTTNFHESTPWEEVEAAIVHAFCHPAHISKGMVMVSVETATKSRDTLHFMSACGRDMSEANYTAISELTAAIDAARKEG